MTRELRKIQTDLIDHFCDKIFDGQNVAGWCPPGGGKTATTLVTLDRLDLAGVDMYPALVVAPPRVAKNTWPAEVSEWPDHLPDTRIVAAVGTADERKAALRQGANITSINYENLEWLVEHIGYANWPFKTVVADEATALRNLRVSFQKHHTSGKEFMTGQGSVRAKALAKMVFQHHNRVIELTGTPAPNGLANLYGQLMLLDRGQRLGRTYEAFTKRWFQRSWNGFGLDPLPHAQAEIGDRVKDICMSIRINDYYDIKEANTIPIYVDLPPAQMKLYKEFEKKLFVQIKGHPIEAFSAGAKTAKCQQLANGACYVGEDDGSDTRPFVEAHDEKMQALESLIEDANGMPIIVAYKFRSDLARLKKRFPNAVYFDKNKKTEDDFNAGKIPMLIVSYGAAHGSNLQWGTNICVIYGNTWDLELYQQVVERAGPVRQWQAGLNRPCFVYVLVARGTVDEDMLERQASKKSVQDILMEAARRRG